MEGGLVVSKNKILSRKAIEVVYDYFEISCGNGELNFDTEIPVGKAMDPQQLTSVQLFKLFRKLWVNI